MSEVKWLNLNDLFDKTGVDFITGVPDSEFKVMIEFLEKEVIGTKYQLATKEDNAVALASGAYLAGRTPLVFMESSGVGNMLDVLTSLVIVYRIPLVLLIAWAGYKERDVPHHNAIGRPLEDLLSSLDVHYEKVPLWDFDQVIQSLARTVQESRLRMQPCAVLGIPETLTDPR